MFSSRAKEDPVRHDSPDHGDLEDACGAGVEKRSTRIENDLPLPGVNYRAASGDDFWSDLAEISEEEADQFIAMTSAVSLHETTKDDVLLRSLRAVAFFRKAWLIFSRQGRHWDNDTLVLVEKSLTDFRAADELAGSGEGFPHAALEESRDAAAKALEAERPGRAQEILGKTKLAYMGSRLFFRNGQYVPSAGEMAVFEKIFFHYPVIARSAEILYKVLGEPGRRYISVLLYGETSPRNSAGEENDPLCVICLVEDGTFHLVKDLVAGPANAGAGEKAAEDGKPEHEEQPGQKARGVKDARERTDPEGNEDCDGKKRSGEVAGQARGGRGRKTGRLLIACAFLLGLMIALFLLKSYPLKSVGEPKKEMMPVQDAVAPSHLLSEPPENRSWTKGEPGSLDKINGHYGRGALAAGVKGKKKKRARETAGNVEGQGTTDTARTTETPALEIKKRSFPPHSRDDL